MIEKMAAALTRSSTDSSIVGMSNREVQELMENWGVAVLPKSYRQFLRLLGRSAGCLLRGTDAFYPGTLDLQRDVAEILDGIRGVYGRPKNEIAIAVHQGYQVYCMELNVDDPPVRLYSESDREPIREWSTFSNFIYLQAQEDCPNIVL